MPGAGGQADLAASLGRLVDLPAPRAGTRYVVSRVTALAAQDRGDLVFPFGEVGDNRGRVTGARGLASFGPGRDLAASRGVAGGGAGTAAGTAAGQADADRRAVRRCYRAAERGAVAVPGALDAAKASGWGELRGRRGRCGSPWCSRYGVAALAVAAWRWHRRGVMLEERGTAYVIGEQAITWRHEEKESVLADVGDGFAAVLRVPGPAELGSDWRWGGRRAACPAVKCPGRMSWWRARLWGRAFQRQQITRDAVFVGSVAGSDGVWRPGDRAPPRTGAACAAAAELRRGRAAPGGRGWRMTLMTSSAATDRRSSPRWSGLHEPMIASEMVTMTIRPLGAPVTGQHGDPGGHGAVQSRPDTEDGAAGMLLLIVRVTHGMLGPVPVDLASTGPFTVHVAPGLAGRVIPAGTRAVRVVEWRLAPRAAGQTRVPELPWQAFPAAAGSIADWVVAQATAHPGRVVLLATRIPQELAVGLGVQLGQRSWDRTSGQQWPQQVYPVLYAGDSLVIPDLQLGAGIRARPAAAGRLRCPRGGR